MSMKTAIALISEVLNEIEGLPNVTEVLDIQKFTNMPGFFLTGGQLGLEYRGPHPVHPHNTSLTLFGQIHLRPANFDNSKAPITALSEHIDMVRVKLETDTASGRIRDGGGGAANLSNASWYYSTEHQMAIISLQINLTGFQTKLGSAGVAFEDQGFRVGPFV